MLIPIVINGYPGAGKDTFVDFCGEVAPVFNLLTSTPAKEYLKTMGWDGEKTPEVRNYLSSLKDMSTLYFDYPVRYITEEVSKLRSDFVNGLIFIHSREPQEIDRFKKELGAITLFIYRTPLEQIYCRADRNVNDYWYDEVISNQGTLEEFRRKAHDFANLFKDRLFELRSEAK